MDAGATPEGVVRAYLEFERQIDVDARWIVARAFRDETALESEVWRHLGAVDHDVTLNVRRLRVVSETGERATVDVDAFLVAHVKSRHGVQTTDHRFRGPVELVREDGAWRVASFVLDGIPSSLMTYDGRVDTRAGGVRVRVGGRLRKRSTSVALVVENDGEDVVAVEEFEVRARFWRWLERRVAAAGLPHAVAAGETWATQVGWARLGLRTPVDVCVVVDGERVRSTLVPRGPLPLRFRLRRVHPERMIDAMMAISIATSALTRSLAAAAVALVVAGLVAVVKGGSDLYARSGSTGARVYAAFGAVQVALGAVLMVANGFGWGATALVIASTLATMHRALAVAAAARRSRATAG